MTIKSILCASVLAVTPLLAGCMTTGSGSGSTGQLAGSIHEGRCRMGGCSWFQIQNFDVVRENTNGALLRVTLREGASDHPDNNYPRRPRESQIRWAESSTVYFLCSTRYPALISEGEGGRWEGYRLDLTTPSGASEFVHNQYRAVCHPDGALNLDTAGAAARLGYRSFEGDSEISLPSPEALFDQIG